MAIKVVLYAAVSDVPPARKFLSQIILPGDTKPAGVIFYAETASLAVAEAEVFWEEQVEKERKKKENALASSERAKRAHAERRAAKEQAKGQAD